MRNRADKIKTISLSGELISSNLYLHGDASASETISALAAPYRNNIPFIEGEGTFGTKVAPTSWAAPRYTYVKRANAGNKLVYRDLDIVPLRENYDGSTWEPETFLPIVPIVLLNSVSGIAVGWSTEILPRKLNDLIDATIAAIDGKKIKRLVPTYDYLNLDVKHLEANTWEFTGKFNRVDASTIQVTELPVDLNSEKFIARLIKMEDDGEIQDFEDASTSNIDIQIKFKRGAIKDWSDEKIINVLKLRTKKTERIVVIDWKGDAIRQYETAEDLVKDFVEWRMGWYVKRYQKLLADTEYDLKYWLGVKACFDSDLPGKLVKMTNKASVEKEVTSVTQSIGLDDKQIDKIVSLPTYRWAKDALQQCKEKIAELKGDKKTYSDLLKSDTGIRDIFRQEVQDLKKEKFVII
jgi:DNA gyrase/topoisomerase IV subunit A